VSGDDDLAAYAARLRSLRTLPSDAAREAAPLIEAEIKKTAAAGTAPSGEPWPTKKDGSRALPNAANAIRAVANGAAVIITLAGAYVWHHYSKGKHARPVIPKAGEELPPGVVKALQEAAAKIFRSKL
jgi:hypothetical protein